MGIRNTVTVDLGLIVKRYLLVGVLIFGLVASVGAFLPENLAFADEDDDKDKHEDDRKKGNEKMSNKELTEEVNLLNLIAQAWNSAIEAMDLALQSFETRLSGVETQMVEDKATIESLKIQVDDLSGASGIGASSGIIAMTESYTNTVSGSIASNSAGTLSASCNEGDLAVSGQLVVISGNEDTMTIYGADVSDMKTYSVEAENEDSSISFDIDVSVNCLLTTSADVSKAGVSGLDGGGLDGGAGSGGLS